MPSPQAAERKRERNREWHHNKGKERRIRRRDDRDMPSGEVWGDDDKWMIVTCPGCQRLFDNPKRGGRRYTHCPECRK